MNRNALSMLLCSLFLLPGQSPWAASELRIGYTSDLQTLDPAAHRDRGTQAILRNVFEGLVGRDQHGALQPQLAESWTRVDPVTYEFRLRKGIRFHDGLPLTAEDVAFTFRRLIDPGAIDGMTSPRKSLLGPLESVEMVDEQTVRFHLAEPWPMFPRMLSLQEVVNRTLQSSDNEDEVAIGTGPFMLTEWLPGRAVVLDRSSDYRGDIPDRSSMNAICIDRVVFRVVSHNDSRVAGLLAGDFQVIKDVPSALAGLVDAHPDLHTVEVDGNRSYFLALNLRAPPFSDIRVRRAIAKAIDRDPMIDKHFLGRATKINGILSPAAFGKNDKLPAHDHDPKAARALLTEAGFGSGLRVSLYTGPEMRRIAESIALQLADIGIDVALKVTDRVAMRRTWFEDSPPAGGMLLTSWGNASLDPVGIFTPTHRSGGRGNSSGHSDPALDELLGLAATEPDSEHRARLYEQAELLASRAIPYVYLWVRKEVYGVSNSVTGWQPRADGLMDLRGVCLQPSRSSTD